MRMHIRITVCKVEEQYLLYSLQDFSIYQNAKQSWANIVLLSKRAKELKHQKRIDKKSTQWLIYITLNRLYLFLCSLFSFIHFFYYFAQKTFEYFSHRLDSVVNGTEHQNLWNIWTVGSVHVFNLKISEH